MAIYKSIISSFKVSFMVVPSERGMWVYLKYIIGVRMITIIQKSSVGQGL